jgi:hypothetical protein
MSDHDKGGSQPIDSKVLSTRITEGGCSRVVQSEFYESRDALA